MTSNYLSLARLLHEVVSGAHNAPVARARKFLSEHGYPPIPDSTETFESVREQRDEAVQAVETLTHRGAKWASEASHLRAENERLQAVVDAKQGPTRLRKIVKAVPNWVEREWKALCGPWWCK